MKYAEAYEVLVVGKLKCMNRQVSFQQEWFKEELNSTLWDLKTKDKEFSEASNEPIIVPAYEKVL